MNEEELLVKLLKTMLSQITFMPGWDEDEESVELAQAINEQLVESPDEIKTKELYKLGYSKEEIYKEVELTKEEVNEVTRKIKTRERQKSSKKRAYQQEELILNHAKSGATVKEIADSLNVMQIHVRMIIKDDTARKVIKEHETMTVKELSRKYDCPAHKIRDLLKRFN